MAERILHTGARYIVVRVLGLGCSKRPNPSEYGAIWAVLQLDFGQRSFHALG